jgi:hypothetical protein
MRRSHTTKEIVNFLAMPYLLISKKSPNLLKKFFIKYDYIIKNVAKKWQPSVYSFELCLQALLGPYGPKRQSFRASSFEEM